MEILIGDGERRQLAAILGMLGSNHAGERDNAAQAAEKFRRCRGATWDQLISQTVYVSREVYIDRPAPPPSPEPPPAPASMADWLHLLRDRSWYMIITAGPALVLITIGYLAQH